MTILGIDPGTATTGYGVIERVKPGEFKVLDFGVITTKKGLTDSARLAVLANDIRELLATYKPKVAGVEKLYFETNQKTAMSVAQARGVVALLLEEVNVQIHEFTPLQVKNTICGYGKADKKQVQYVVQKTFKLLGLPKPDDAADALAIALCAGLKR